MEKSEEQGSQFVEISVSDMRAAGKPGYVARIEGQDRQFLTAHQYPGGHGSSHKTVIYRVSLNNLGLFEICDANYGGQKRKLTYLAISSTADWSEFDDRAEAERFLNPPQSIVASAYPGLKQEVEAEEPVFDVRISRLVNGQLKV